MPGDPAVRLALTATEPEPVDERLMPAEPEDNAALTVTELFEPNAVRARVLVEVIGLETVMEPDEAVSVNWNMAPVDDPLIAVEVESVM